MIVFMNIIMIMIKIVFMNIIIIVFMILIRTIY